MKGYLHEFHPGTGIHKVSEQRGMLSDYDLDIVGGDFAFESTSGNGQRFIAVSINPLVEDHQSTITYKTPVKMPFSLAAPMSISQRAKHSFFTLEAVDIDSEFTNVRTPIAIASISQSTTTLTIVLTEACNLQRDERFHVYGLADTRLNYPYLTVATLSADRKTITATVSDDATITSATATSYGGMVAVRNGQVPMVGYASTAIQSISIDDNGIMTVIGNATWGTIVVGEYVNLHGVRSAVDGSDMGLDGVYQLIDLSTTTIKLIAVKDINGNLVKDGNGDNVTPTLNVMGTTNCGGAVIQRTTARLHDLKLTQYNQEMVKIWGQGEDRADLAVPVSVKNSLTIGAWSVNPSVATLTTAATTNATSAKTTAGQVFSLDVTNTSAAVIYLKLYNKTSAPTVGTDVPIATIPIPANSFATHSFGTLGKRFAAGISFAVTGAMAATDTTAVAAGCYVNLQYV